MGYNKPVMVDDLQLVTRVPRISLHTNLRCIKRRRKGTGWGVGGQRQKFTLPIFGLVLVVWG